MKRVFGIFLMACIVFSANAQLLWKVTGKGLDKPSYLFGTHHLAPASILDNVSGFQQAFDGIDQVIGEVIMSEMMSSEAMGIMQKSMLIENDTTLKMLMTPDEFDMVHKFAKENLMVDIEVASNLKPAFLNNSIAVFIAMKSIPNYDPQFQLDGYLQQKGIEKNKKIDGFETLEFQLNMLFNSQSLKRQTELLVCSLLDTDKLMEQSQKLTDYYTKQDIDGLFKLTLERDGDKCDPLPGEMKAIVDDRNIRWAEVFPEKIKNGSAFIVVGALHLPGENGLINLLKLQGYTVEAVK